MNVISQELERQVLHPAMHQKILLRAAELVEQGWTRRTAARAADGQKVRSTSPAATSWCVVGAVDRALYELLNIDVYGLLDLDVASDDTASCPAGVMSELRRPLRQIARTAQRSRLERSCLRRSGRGRAAAPGHRQVGRPRRR